MHPIRWNPDLATGHADIDADHRAILELIDRVLDLDRGRHAIEQIGSVLEELERYTTRHFEREEALMAQVDYPDAEAHRREHCVMRADVMMLAAEYRAGRVSAPRLTHYLRQWLPRHIAGFDAGLCLALARSGSETAEP